MNKSDYVVLDDCSFEKKFFVSAEETKVGDMPPTLITLQLRNNDLLQIRTKSPVPVVLELLFA